MLILINILAWPFQNLVNQNYNQLKLFAKVGTITKISQNIQEETITILKQKTAYNWKSITKLFLNPITNYNYKLKAQTLY